MKKRIGKLGFQATMLKKKDWTQVASNKSRAIVFLYPLRPGHHLSFTENIYFKQFLFNRYK